MTRNDVITSALRILRVISRDEPPVADDAAYAGSVLDSLLAEVGQEAPLPFDSNNVPAASEAALSEYLAAALAKHFSSEAPSSFARAKLRFVATIRPDSRMEIDGAEFF